ncbi:MAG TPA: hypothetical protein GXX34_04695 [Clostridia bacterium]|nr:hypothetical protein [Clostridia bacterium]
MKKIFAVLLVLAMSAAFVVGCSGGEEGTPPAENPAGQEEVQGEAGTEAQEEAAEPAGEDNQAAAEVETEQEQ